ncbi:Protein apnoia [Pseudolycoriella hygida]|uniref:Protein apnoia n=1 Tax=Pseudolycoriella hygida TaxID=35572 RepID=A0A9Q0MVD1_9DIPT|nr:Protein apnoia [Pseudolycoriella hygida]
MSKIEYVVCVMAALLCLVNTSWCQETMSNEDTNMTESRTFGHHFLKRISFALIPASFIVGVITTLLAALTVVSIKGLGVGIILLVIAFGQILSRALPAALPLSSSTQYQGAYPVVYSQRQDPVWIEKPAWR